MKTLNLKDLTSSKEESGVCLIYKSENPNCGVKPDENNTIFQFGSFKEDFPTEHIKLFFNAEIKPNELANNLRKLANIIERKETIEYLEA